MQRVQRSVSILLVMATAAFGLLLSEGRSAAPRLISGDGGPAAGPFTIAGSVSGLYPGAVKTLVLDIVNANPYTLVVTSLSATVGESDHAGCSASNVTVDGFSGAVTVPPSATVGVPVTVRMIPSPADACQGASWPLTYLGQGSRTPLPTDLLVDPVVAKLSAQKQTLTLGKLSAVLRVDGTTQGIANKVVVFKINNEEVCRGVTRANGRYTCEDIVISALALSQLRYTARFAGDADYLPTLGTGRLVTGL